MMKTDYGDDDLVDLNTARREFIPLKNGKPLSQATLWRWRTRGVDGVKLEITHVGSMPCTSRRRINEFFAKVTEAKSAKILKAESPVSDSELREAGLL